MTEFHDPLSKEIWNQNYRAEHDSNVDDSFYRVAQDIASAEKDPEQQKEWTNKFFEMLKDFKVVPGGRILANAGTDFEGTTLINCFVHPKEEKSNPDSIEGIYNSLLTQAKTLKSEGGWGHNFSALRPRGSFIEGIGVTSPGSVRFMDLFDRSSEIVTSGSGVSSGRSDEKKKIRKGAMMAVLDVWHPDIIEFITAKQTGNRLTKFNISVNMTDAFMNKVKKVKELKKRKEQSEEISQELIDQEDQWELVFPDSTHEAYNTEWDGDINKWIENGYPVETYRTVSATWLFDLAIESTYNRAEPGVLFLDRANYFYPANYKNKIVATNPCGEQQMPPAGSCNLSSINITQFIKSDLSGVDYEKLRTYVHYLVRFLDNVNDVSLFPLKEYEDFAQQFRRIGLGVMGWGSALLMMRIPFGNKTASEMESELMDFISKEAYKASIDLAEEKGPFPECEPENHLETPFVQKLSLSDNYKEKLKRVGIRNSSILSNQPTGTTSIFANVVSGGVEPVFSSKFIRTMIVPETPNEIKEVTPDWAVGEFHETSFFKYDKEGDETILKGTTNEGRVYKIDKNRGLTTEEPCIDYGRRILEEKGLWDENAEWAKFAMDLSVSQHLDSLKNFSYYVDSSISKTINVPHEYSFEEFKDIYFNAYETGHVKGLTTYREGTMAAVLSDGKESEQENEEEEIIKDDVKLPSESPAMVKKLKAEGKKWYLTCILSENKDRPFALFVQTNSKEPSAQTHDVVERIENLARNKGIPEKHINDVLAKINGDNNTTKVARMLSLVLRHGVAIKNIVATIDEIDDVFVGSFLFQIKKFLSQYVKDGAKIEGKQCQQCGSNNLVFKEGCVQCNDCFSSECG